VTKVDITKIDRDFFGVSGLWSEFVDIVGHCYHPNKHLGGWYMDGLWLLSRWADTFSFTTMLTSTALVGKTSVSFRAVLKLQSPF
jgi:hypothetical protein